MATDIVVRQANREMLFWVYGAVILLCLVTFRSRRAVICAVLPLVLASILCEALMVALNMGILLAFMFLWNMLGALILLPALACFLLPRQPAPITKNDS